MKKVIIAASLAVGLTSATGAHDVLHGSHSDHEHGKACGHSALEHAGHVDYMHDGHLHHAHDGHVDEHTLTVTSANPDAEELVKAVDGEEHMHGHDGEEHDVVQHGTHFDYIHNGRLHHVHGDHTDDHGAVTTMKNT